VQVVGYELVGAAVVPAIAPSKTKTVPATYLCTNGSDRPVSKRVRSALAVSAYRASVMQPITTNDEPRMSDCKAGDPRSGSINCGKNDKKNKATFGLKILTTMPCVNDLRNVTAVEASENTAGFRKRVRTPMKTK